jgi:hypothetical protein
MFFYALPMARNAKRTRCAKPRSAVITGAAFVDRRNFGTTRAGRHADRAAAA